MNRGSEVRKNAEALFCGEEMAVAVQRFETYLPFGRPNFSEREIEAAARILRSGWIGMGNEVIAFEDELAAYFGAPHVVTVNSCTSALFLAMLVSGIQPGDEVICPSLTWCASANAALYLDARPVFCDVDPRTLCATTELILAKLTSRTKAVVVVHFGGYAMDVAPLREALPSHVAIVEDAAHALGAKYADGTCVGSSGNLTCFSFYANKNLSTGEGGGIALRDGSRADRLRSLRQNAMPVNAWMRFSRPQSLLYTGLEELGYKMNYMDLLAAIGRVQLSRQPEFMRARRTVAETYCLLLGGPGSPLQFQRGILHPHHARHLFPVLLPVESMSKTRDEIILRMRARNVGATIHYAPLHSMPLYAASRREPLAQTERIAESILTLPISASMDAEQASRVAAIFREELAEAGVRDSGWPAGGGGEQ
jgi:perosamine synthetase